MRNKFLIPLAIVIQLAVVFTSVSVLHAETLQEAIDKVLDSHDKILAAKADLKASKSRVKESKANSWAPALTLTTHYGHEMLMKKAPGTDTDMESREFDISITQRLLDWGQAAATIDVTLQQKHQMEEALDLARQTLILDAITSYYNLDRTKKMVVFAQKSVENIKRQGEVEDIRVSLGKGYSADVLQVKTQLAGAEARLVQSKGAMLLAENHIKAVYMRPADEVANLEVPIPDYNMLPKTVDEVVQRAVVANPQARQLAFLTKMLKSQSKSIFRTTFFPTLNAVYDYKMKRGVSGTREYVYDSLGKLEITFPFNLGLSGVDTVRAARRDRDAASRRHGDVLLVIEEQARSAWSNLHTARSNAALLNNQANLAAKFLDLAREERKLDKRTLLDVLNGETALINARSDAYSAETDVKIAFYTLMMSMGVLSTDLLSDGFVNIKE
ncbi:MAG: TolC family protein [Magnetococcales bacterium]|nr:TolC family protein [Magnetococcales bacterium]